MEPPNGERRRTRPGKFEALFATRLLEEDKTALLAERTAELIRHLRREPSYPERIIIARAVAVEWDLRRTDAKLDAGEEPSGHMLRARLAAENRLRLDLTALGLKPAAPPQPSLAEILAGGREHAA